MHSSLLHTLISPRVDFWQFLFHHDWNILLWILAIQSSSCAIVHQYTFSCNSIQKCIWHLRRIQIFEVSSNWNCILLQKVQLFKWRQQSFGTYSIVKCYIILNWECFFLPNNLERKTNCTATQIRREKSNWVTTFHSITKTIFTIWKHVGQVCGGGEARVTNEDGKK